MNRQITLLGACSVVTLGAVYGAEDLLVADFEQESYGDWKVEGEAFGPGPAKGTLPGQMHVTGYMGKSLVNTFFNRDGTVGKLTSPPLVIERDYLSFLIGGGAHAGKTCMNLLLNGQVVRTQAGSEDEALQPTAWDVRELKGKTVTIQIVDQEKVGREGRDLHEAALPGAMMICNDPLPGLASRTGMSCPSGHGEWRAGIGGDLSRWP